MKKFIRIILACCAFISLSAPSLWAQEPAVGQYILKLGLEGINNANDIVERIFFRVYTRTETNIEIGIYQYDTDNVSSGESFGFPYTETILEIRPSTLYFSVSRDNYSQNEITNSYVISSSTAYIDEIIGNGSVFADFMTQADLKLHPYKIGIGYFNSEGIADGTFDLPDNDPITLKATKGFVTSTYQWQYSTDNGNNWGNFPTSFQGKEEITFNGRDIFSSSQFASLAGKTVWVRIGVPTHEESILILHPRTSAPTIDEASVYEQETCHGADDNKVLLKLSRPLETGEMIVVGVDGFMSEGERQFTELGAGNSVVLNDIESGERQFTISGYFNGDLTYTSSPVTLSVPSRPKITSDILSVKNVSCNAGSDGEIVVEAAGGTKSYIAKLYHAYQNDVIQEVAFGQSGMGTFARLAQGDYEIRVFDTNDCTAYNDNGTVRILQATVGQPAQPLTAGLEFLTPPMAYDSHDGKATVRIGGGTPGTSGYTALLTHSGGQTYSPSVKSTDGGDALYTFDGLPRGDYSLSVQDANYASLDPQDKAEPCGCVAALTFYLDAPPAISVTIEETHFVNWHGGNQGILVAHANGGIQFLNDLPYQYTWYRQSDGGAMQQLSIAADSIARNLIAGLYQVKVTDANGASKTSEIYTLTQPDPIRVQFNVTNTGCYGDASGKISTTVSGGVSPYTYQWNLEGETQSEVTSLEAGKYMLKVTDDRGGHLLSSVDVGSSSTLEVDSLVVQPTCLTAGSIKLQLSGATPPYTIKWDDTSRTDLVRDDLMPGTYRVTITDANGCANAFVFQLAQPRGFTVDIGGDLVMCRNQSRVVEAVCAEPDVAYEWYRDNVKLPDSGARITVDSEGDYRVTVTNPQGCFATDQINVRVITETLELDMAVPTTVEVGSEIHAINLSKVSADRIEWKLPEGAVIVSQSDTELVFALTKKGSYEIYMEGFKGEGATIVTRTIDVVDKGEVSLPDSEKPLIKQFWVTPTPSTGIFKVIVELNQVEDFTMILYSPQGVEMDRKVVEGVQSKTFEYEVNGVLQGTYLLHLITRSDKSVLQVVIKK